MPVTINVSDIRSALLAASGPAHTGSSGSALCGAILHETLEELLDADTSHGWNHTLTPADLDDPETVARGIYGRILGPRLAANRGALQAQSLQVMNLWRGLSGFTRLLCELLKAASERKLISYNPDTEAWRNADSLFLLEESLQWDVNDLAWPAPVRIQGIADAIWRNPANGYWCVLEFKSGIPRPEADLAQACLYHRMIAASRPNWGVHSGVAIIRFGERLTVERYTRVQIEQAYRPLHELIGRLGQSAASTPPPPPKPPLPSDEHRALGKRIIEELDGGVDLAGDPVVGPAYLRFVLRLQRGVRVKQIQARAEDLQVRLGLERRPIIHNASGQLVVDVQRPDPEIVDFASLRLPPANPIFGCAHAVLGVDLMGEVRTVDLAAPETPHLLVAGTSGSGKSEWLRSMIAGLVRTNTPATLRLVLIDPKRTAFSDLKGSRFLFDGESIIYPPDQSAAECLERLVEEMERRYTLIEKHGCDDIAGVARHIGAPLARVVCVCDEYADLVTADRTERKRIEQAIVRLGSKARSAGIHLVIATQYPVREIVTGTLKANLGGRVCFRTTSATQSNVIGTPDAEHLLGRGDMLFKGSGDIQRLQAPYLDPARRQEILRGHEP